MTTEQTASTKEHFPRLFEPIQLGPLEVKNRLAMTPGGGISDRYFEDRARGGCGLIIQNYIDIGVRSYIPTPGRFDPSRREFLYPDAVPPDPSTPEGIKFFDDLVRPHLGEFVKKLHRYGVVFVVQLAHLGAAAPFPLPGLIPTAGPSAYRDEENHLVSFAFEEEHIASLVEGYGQAARRAREAGVDGVELHAAHGYLLQEFLSPYTNKRTDRYGGSFDKRLTILREILDCIDRLAGPDFPVGMRIVGDEFTDKGLSAADITAIVAAIEDRLIYVNVSGNATTGLMDVLSIPYAPPWYVPPGYNAAASATIKRSTAVPILLTGRVFNPAQAEKLLAEETADLIGMNRGWLADPDWGVKAQAGKQIRPCIGTNECHRSNGSSCTVNPAASREDELAITQVPVRRNVLVAGGGPAGLQAAHQAALRGHHVVLCEKADRLGGQALIMALDPTYEQLRDWLDYLERTTREAGVEIRTGIEATPELVVTQGYDVVIAATGATPFRPDIHGITSPHVVTSSAVLQGETAVGKTVLVIAGLDDHIAPLSIADVLAQRGHAVTLTSEAVNIGEALEPRTLHQILKRLLDKDVQLLAMTRVTEIHDHVVSTCNILTGKTGSIGDFDTVVLSMGGVADDALANQLRGVAAEVHRVGDALAPRRLIHAVLEGTRAAMAI